MLPPAAVHWCRYRIELFQPLEHAPDARVMVLIMTGGNGKYDW
jgi:hypothetical protein